jgi:hypothetical protein
MSRGRKSNKEDRIPTVAWERHPEWTISLITVCIENEEIREGLFHDSRKEKGNVTGKHKTHWIGLLYEKVFGDLLDINNVDVRRHYCKSIINRLAK